MRAGRRWSSMKNGLKVEARSSVGRFPIMANGKELPWRSADRQRKKIRLARNVPAEEFSFLRQAARKPVKVALISPDRIAQRFDWQNSKTVYFGLDEFVADVVQVEHEIIRGLVEGGCQY